MQYPKKPKRFPHPRRHTADPWGVVKFLGKVMVVSFSHKTKLTKPICEPIVHEHVGMGEEDWSNVHMIAASTAMYEILSTILHNQNRDLGGTFITNAAIDEVIRPVWKRARGTDQFHPAYELQRHAYEKEHYKLRKRKVDK
jgi:hypothetical protein|tara:strand:+ start:501 stop:923 length:423 start_codon:yes stop_codon:yes gene_type:complete